MIRFVFSVALLIASVPPAIAADAFPQSVTFGNQAFSLLEKGTMKAHALVGSVTIFDFAKYAAPDQQQLLVLRAARKLSAKQLQQVFRGIVAGSSGFSDAQLEAFLNLLPSADSGTMLRLRSDPNGLQLLAGDTLAGSVEASPLATAIWAGFSGEKVAAHK